VQNSAQLSGFFFLNYPDYTVLNYEGLGLIFSFLKEILPYVGAL
jgi:hypothetical protein